MWCILATATQGQVLTFGAMTGGKGQIPNFYEGRTYELFHNSCLRVSRLRRDPCAGCGLVIAHDGGGRG